ncbi:glycoside hydrolase family 3 C-terminal domain-containing protein [Chitinophagaceae bacterium LB-8]|uniref:Glycoside hydrolase family 3 C-terminal domain-containing protein n=1 Tax=Paraflavisolibacter caeni TaxID=2982496 RepID=A0A9X2XWU6_9BACT|nr:glycoside hydrolase family 3 C-terminal domain-containing protein [Paraflavisolibacter caeni]MCU7550171.1 glycoside hydrolase family 3 C-terminal domain-containing protein [Paraflavisolibacter caeni]
MKGNIVKASCSLVIVYALMTAGGQAKAQTANVDAAIFQGDNAIYQKIEQQIKQMTLEEKVGMIHGNSTFTSAGVKRLNIPELTMSDGPHGVRMEHDNDHVFDSATYLPTGVCLAATWNPQLGYAFGSVLGSEANYRGKDVILGPGLNIIRSALNGRNFEYQSEDPYLISKMVVGYIKGVQDQGVAACAKHYLANNQETRRGSINVLMSERALREIYLPGFKAAVQEGGVYTVMGAYNKFRGQFCTHNDYLVNKILKGELGFKGVLMSDWSAVHNTMEALWNGTDLEMGTDLDMLPNPNYGKFYLGDTVIALVKAGRVDEKLIDEKVRRILYVMHKTDMFGKRKQGTFSTKEHAQTALKVAEEGIVLLKNGNLLPLKQSSIKSIAVIGVNANRLQSEGGGSSQVRTRYEITPLEGFKAITAGKIKISYAPGYSITKGAGPDQQMINEAVAAAKKADIAIVVGGWTHGYNKYDWSDNAYDAEGTDKPDMDMPFGQNELINAVVKANPKTIVVLMGGGPIDVSKWIDHTPSVIQSWYPGMEGGNALAKIIFGAVNPSGKLPMTFPKTLSQSPAHALGQYPGDSVMVHYNDDIFVGYRYFDTYNVEPQFAFGHGLSYTTFKYSNLKVEPGNESATVTFTVSNVGKTAGAEVAQVYVKDDESILRRPEKELKGFQKVFLNPGESKTVTVNLTKEAFQYYNDMLQQWVLEKGGFTLFVGSSSRDIRLTGKLKL